MVEAQRHAGGGGAMKILQAAQYQPLAHTVFAEVAAQVGRLLPLARIEHIGASSIPGAASKGDLDICVVVAPDEHAAAVQTLLATGYTAKTGTLRTAELCMLLAPRSDLDTALQVIAAGSRFEFFMQFRDALRADPALVERYNQLKTEFAATGEERYRAHKARFIEAVLRAA